MNFLKRFVSLMFLLHALSSAAQVHFEEIFSFQSNPISEYHYNNAQMIDVDGDNEKDIVWMQEVDGNLYIECYKDDGTFISQREILTGDLSIQSGYLVWHNQELLVLSSLMGYYDFGVMIHDYETEALQDSLSLNEYDWGYEVEQFRNHFIYGVSTSDSLVIFVGNERQLSCESGHSGLNRFSYEDSLSYHGVLNDNGFFITEFDNCDYLISIGANFLSEAVVPVYHNEWYLNLISKNDLNSFTSIYDCTGTNAYGQYSHYPDNFILLNQNEQSIDEFGIIIHVRVTDDIGSYSRYRCYNPITQEEIWAINDSVNYGSSIKASTAISINHFDEYVLMIKEDFLEVRDKLSGEIMFQQDSEINPEIIMKGINEDILYIDYEIGESEIVVYRTDDVLFVDSEEDELPDKIASIKFYPNPFSLGKITRGVMTTIEFNIPEKSEVDLSIYNVKGQLVNSLLKEKLDKGKHRAEWDGQDSYNRSVSSGIYFAVIKNEKDVIASQKCLLLK